ncbi:MAG TPA: magnesium protoporphyrin IX methyltransferase [Anaerolineae bacterium]|nr:magnesium protoporphyrin IX methyltransferase [Anaerolineae bacterium]HMR64888.1 magnesium protoporphyrin IX methyltransferase [Anaerolineae bacterium]
MTTDSAAHKVQLQSYFNGIGFERWSAIYGQAPLSRIRRTVREGHELMLAQVDLWLSETRSGGTLLDAGCGTGLFSVAMARRGFEVTAIDIAPRMVQAAQAYAQQAGVADRIRFMQGDLESVSGSFDAVVCLDVLVHYPREAFERLSTLLAQRCATGPLLFTYAPYNRFLALLHWLGGHFPKDHRRAEIQMTPDRVVNEVLAAAGMCVRRTADISHGFYHIKLLEAVREETRLRKEGLND